MQPLYLFALTDDATPYAYDEMIAAGCLQGLCNRQGPSVYVLCPDDERRRRGSWHTGRQRERATPHYWLDRLTSPGGWLAGRERVVLRDLDALFEACRAHVRGIAIWDPDVPATVNVATTAAGVDDLVVCSPELYASHGARWGLPVLLDLRGMFDGRLTGSAKNDAYRWAIETYLRPGRCSSRLIGLYHDAWAQRGDRDEVYYAIERDRLVMERAFAFDLSIWDHYAPLDDPGQPLGTDSDTYERILDAVYRHAAGRHMTEMAGFFHFDKQPDGEATNGVPTEWETVWRISPYNIYQNTVAHLVYNQSLHRWAPNRALRQNRPAAQRALEGKSYLAIQICDFDSTTPLYDVLPTLWDDPARGALPLCWGLNPNLVDVFPDLFAHFYATRTANDFFASDASAAGYFNPSRIRSEHWEMVTRHNERYFRHCDMTIAGMVLDSDWPGAEVLRAYARFAPDGFASLAVGSHMDAHPAVSAQVYAGMPVGFMTNVACDWTDARDIAAKLNAAHFSRFRAGEANFVYYRTCYRGPSDMLALCEELRRTNPGLEIEVVDPYTYFELLRQTCEREGAVAATRETPRAGVPT